MSQTPPFIKAIQINKVRHLQNIEINLDDSQPRHLILTGPNGSGKTSLLRMLAGYLEGIPTNQLQQVESWKQNLSEAEALLETANEMLTTASSDESKAQLRAKISDQQHHVEYLQAQIAQFSAVQPSLSDLFQLTDLFHKGQFLIGFFEAKRSASITAAAGAVKLELPKTSAIRVNQQSVGSRFLQFLVNQENRAALLLRKKDQKGVDAIQAWMDKVEGKFRELFQNKNLRLEYDIDNFDFTINIPGRDPFRLVENELSDGFSAVIHIVAELLMRMEAVAPNSVSWDIPGIVLIDEIETHLHIRLQKAILPFLSAFFPNIQFIVTTHSPFVLTSLKDAVVYDLEAKVRWENMTPLSASTVVEQYFDLDLYSDEIKQCLSRLEELSRKKRTPEEAQEFSDLCHQLDNLDYERAPELIAQYNFIRAKEASQ